MTLALVEDTQGVPIGRYLLHRQIARGGMATIHIARLMGDEGFSRIVAAKRLLPEFAEDADFVTMFLDEARVASKVHHRNVVPVLDVVATEDEVILVQEYVHGAPLHALLRLARQAKAHVPINVAVSIATQVLAGLHAAHETVDEIGMPLSIVHRDVSPQNIMVSVDGTARLLDFGVAKATMAAHVTREHAFKGKLAYSAPEQLNGAATPRSDVYSLAIVLWELIVGHRMHNSAQGEGEIVAKILSGKLPTIIDALAHEREYIAKDRWHQLELLDPVVTKGLAVEAHDRWSSAAAMEAALSTVVTPASPTEVAAWLKTLGKDLLDKNDRLLAAEEASWRRTAPPGRLTPVPGEVRRSARFAVPAVADASTIAEPQQIRPWWRDRSTVAIGVLGALVIVLLFGIVLATRHHDEAAAIVMPTLAPAPVPLPAATLPPPPPNVSTMPATTVTQPAPEIARPVPARSDPPAIRRVMRPPPPRPPPVPHPPAPIARAAVAPTAPPPSDCSPPYYFEGTKKIFKPNCL